MAVLLTRPLSVLGFGALNTLYGNTLPHGPVITVTSTPDALAHSSRVRPSYHTSQPLHVQCAMDEIQSSPTARLALGGVRRVCEAVVG